MDSSQLYSDTNLLFDYLEGRLAAAEYSKITKLIEEDEVLAEIVEDLKLILARGDGEEVKKWINNPPILHVLQRKAYIFHFTLYSILSNKIMLKCNRWKQLFFKTKRKASAKLSSLELNVFRLKMMHQIEGGTKHDALKENVSTKI